MAFRIYMAGPDVFLPDFGRALFEAKKRACTEHGFVGIAPTDGDTDLLNGAPVERALAIYRGNLAHMRAADAVIANMTPFRGISMDAGTAFEMGFMAALGKPVLAYTHVTADFETRSQSFYDMRGHEALDYYSAGTAIERFGMADNLMMSGSVIDASYPIRVVSVPRGEELTSLAGFKMGLADLHAAQRR